MWVFVVVVSSPGALAGNFFFRGVLGGKISAGHSLEPPSLQNRSESGAERQGLVGLIGRPPDLSGGGTMLLQGSL